MASFNSVPMVRFTRSKQDLSHTIKTSMKVGTLYPIDWVEVLPGDTFINKTYEVTRLASTFLKPVMDELFLDTYHFFVPMRLVYDKTERVFGNPSPSAYTNNNLESVPTTYCKQGVPITSGSIADYLGLPVGSEFQAPSSAEMEHSVIVTPFRAFALIYNQWFRNENTIPEVYVQTGERATSELINKDAWAPNNYCGMPPKVCKVKDYFTSLLPQPQKGSPVETSLSAGYIPVVTRSESHAAGYDNADLRFSEINGVSFTASTSAPANNGAADMWVQGSADNTTNGLLARDFEGSGIRVVPENLWADASTIQSANVNDLRYAFALQKMLERDAIYGTRYNEYLAGHYGVTSPDSRLQITEYLGGSRQPLNVSQVAQTSQATTDSPLANLAGYSWTNGRSAYSKSFTEHGIVMTVACIRYKHSYQQGTARKWTRFKREDFYDPLFATIGQQPVYKYEIFDNGTESFLDPSVLGYSEAWASYRHIPNTVTGQMRSNATNTLDIWHFADEYDDFPVLGPSFIYENSSFVDRTLSVESSVQNSFICDFYFNLNAVRVMPVRSMPGLIDHH